MFYKKGASFSKELLTCRLQVISYCGDVDHPRGSRVLGFLDSPLTFNYRRHDGYFTFNAISVQRVYIDFQIKILGRLFVNDKQILTECFKSSLTL